MLVLAVLLSMPVQAAAAAVLEEHTEPAPPKEPGQLRLFTLSPFGSRCVGGWGLGGAMAWPWRGMVVTGVRRSGPAAVVS